MSKTEEQILKELDNILKDMIEDVNSKRAITEEELMEEIRDEIKKARTSKRFKQEFGTGVDIRVGQEKDGTKAEIRYWSYCVCHLLGYAIGCIVTYNVLS
jgi:hypothetical protein